MQNALTNSLARTRMALLLALAIVLAASLSFATSANASSGQLSLIQDDSRLLSPDPAVRNAALDESKALGMDIVKVAAIWRSYDLDPGSNSKPSSDLTDPSSYHWNSLPEVVQGIIDRGMKPWLMVTAPGPNWSTPRSTASTQEGVYQPDPDAFGKFTEAIAKQFPQVEYWQIGNEPNFQYWLWPQIGKGLVSLSAVHYRKMYIEAQSGLSRSGTTSGDQILFGGLAPRAFLPRVGMRATQPLRFLRDFFCLDPKLKPLKGRAARARSCTGSYKKVTATGFAYHPYTVANGPSVRPTSTDDAPIAYLKRIYRVLDKANKYKRLTKRRIPLWDDEFGFQSDPPDIYGTSIGRIPGYLNASEYLHYRDSRIKSYAQYQLLDDSLHRKFAVGDSDRYGGFQTGLRFENGSKKSGVYNAFEFPFMVFKTKSSGTVSIWGGLRLKQPGVPIDIQVKQGGSFKTLKTVVAFGRYFKANVRTSGAARKSFRFKIGDQTSRTTKPVAVVKARSN